tara:strand:- start:3858 stop:4691 length:834 start_codon:yes stop_codon:yes gene_type:complete
MKTKHNKKRNTAFVYEALINEATISIIKGDVERKQRVVDVIRKHFGPQSILKKDLECYRALYENQNLTPEVSEKVLKEAKMQKMLIDPAGLFQAQTAMIHDVNKEADTGIFNNFVPNYKTLATIDQIFNKRVDPKTQVILESEIVSKMTSSAVGDNSPQSIDNVLYATFVDKFNNKYSKNLMSEQKELLSHYISSFADNSLSLKMYLNGEITRLKEELCRAAQQEEFKNDTDMASKAARVMEKLDSFAQEGVSDTVLLTVLRTQELVEEIHRDGAND